MRRRRGERVLPRVVSLLGLVDLNGSEAFERAVDEEDLHRDIRLDVGLAQERDELATGELLDCVMVSAWT